MSLYQLPDPALHTPHSFQEHLIKEISDTLEKEIKLVELEITLQETNSSKSPGPDSFTVSYSKTFKEKLLPHVHSI